MTMIEDKQMTIAWHVEDLNLEIPHIDGRVVTSIIEWFHVHDYLSMYLDFQYQGKVQIMIVMFLKTTVTEIPGVISGIVAATPGAPHLFDAHDNKECKPLGKTSARVFHHPHPVAQMPLMTITRCRCDAAKAVVFLFICNWVRYPGEDDFCKLKRSLKCLSLRGIVCILTTT